MTYMDVGNADIAGANICPWTVAHAPHLHPQISNNIIAAVAVVSHQRLWYLLLTVSLIFLYSAIILTTSRLRIMLEVRQHGGFRGLLLDMAS
jgi:hypothetical protein